MGACDDVLKQLRQTGRHPELVTGMTVRDAFRRVGADEWDGYREQFRGAAFGEAAE
jgi:hypothetical protein